ncbi:MAG: hypothetical protein KatS3mg111_1513 [Pirellulaceae bacterium]|nr:MAG: hypothetical protein KatS3mg111_1513 [Pirellulaceae bacterium]
MSSYHITSDISNSGWRIRSETNKGPFRFALTLIGGASYCAREANETSSGVCHASRSNVIDGKKQGSRGWLLHLLLAGLLAGGGCSSWKSPSARPTSPLAEPNGVPRPDVVTIDTVTARFPDDQADALNELWNQLDESIVPIEQRQLLAQNGLRVGVVIGQLPPLIERRLQETGQQQESDVVEGAGLATDVDNRMHRLQCRAGKRKEVLVRRVTDPVTVVSVQADGALSGATYDMPAMLLDLRAIPIGAVEAQLRLTPEIHYGTRRQTFVVSDVGIRPSLERPRRVWKELGLDLRLRAGQVLVLGGRIPPKAIGKAFFTTSAIDGTQEHVLLLIRLVGTRVDELFARDELAAARALAEH